MAQKALSLIKLVILIFYFFSIGCIESIEKKKGVVFENVATSQIPNDTIFQNQSRLALRNGVLYLDNNAYSGFIKNVDKSGALKSIASYFNGRQHG